MGRRKELVIDLEALSSRIAFIKDKDEYRRLCCLWLRQIRPKLTNKEIGYATGFSEDHVKTLSVLDSLILPYVNTENMSIFLSEVSRRHPNDFIVMFVDQASWHKSGVLKIPENMKMCDILAYSPELNPVEHVWEEIREKWFPNYSSKKLHQVEDQLETALKTLERDNNKIQKMTGFEWINSVKSNAT